LAGFLFYVIVIPGERSETRDPDTLAFMDPGQPLRGFRDDNL
jgi:hypothetical protein